MSDIPRRFFSLIFLSIVMDAFAGPTVYMKNDQDKLEPILVAVSSTVIPIPVYHVASQVSFGGDNAKQKKLKLKKPHGPSQLITVSGIKKMMAHEQIMPH